MRLRLPRFIRDDAGRKLLALVFAALLWFYVRAQLQETRTLTGIPVTVEYEGDAVYVEAQAVAATLAVQGPKQQLQQLLPEQLAFSIRVPTVAVAGPGFFRLAASGGELKLPHGVKVVPGSIKLTPENVAVDRMEVRTELPIRIQYEGALGEEFAREQTVVPAQAAIRGPSATVRQIRELATEPVRLDASIISAFEAIVKISPIPRVATDVREVKLSVDVSRKTVLKSYARVPLQLLDAPESPWVVTEPLPTVDVGLRAQPRLLEGLDRFAVIPFVDLTDLKAPGRYQRPVKLWHGAPQGVVVESLSPGVVEVVVARRDAAKKAP